MNEMPEIVVVSIKRISQDIARAIKSGKGEALQNVSDG